MSSWMATSLIAQQGGEEAAGVMLFSMCCFFGVFIIFWLIPVGLAIAGMWKTFSKAGKPGWASLVPIYNVMVMSEMAGKDAVYGLTVLIPVAGIYFLFVIQLDMVRRFGKDAGYAIGLMLLPFIFWPMLGFGAAQYRGGGGNPGHGPGPGQGGAGGAWGPPKSW